MFQLLLVIVLQIADSQGHSSVCLWGRKGTKSNSFVNGLWQYQGDFESSPYYAKNFNSTLQYYLWRDPSLNAYCVTSHTPTTNATVIYVLQCTNASASYPWQCDSSWKATDESSVDPDIVGYQDACPQWDCDEIRTTDIGNGCDQNFTIHLSQNEWTNPSRTRYWWFSQSSFVWICDDENWQVLAKASFDQPWIDLVNPTTAELPFSSPDTNTHTIQCIEDPTISSDACLWGRKGWKSNRFINGLWQYQGDFLSNPFYTKTYNSGQYYLWRRPYDNKYYVTSRAPTTGSVSYYMRCEDSSAAYPWQCDSSWLSAVNATFGRIDPDIVGYQDSCPQWDCDAIKTTDIGYGCDQDFSLHLGPNYWSNPSGTRYWLFSSYSFVWVCTDANFSGLAIASFDQPWIDLTKPTTVELPFSSPDNNFHTIQCVENGAVTTADPTTSPLVISTANPTLHPTTPRPSTSPSYHPSADPTRSPMSPAPTADPTTSPFVISTANPTLHPTSNPAAVITTTPRPSISPSYHPSTDPTTSPLAVSTKDPTPSPSTTPPTTTSPSNHPSPHPTASPSLPPPSDQPNSPTTTPLTSSPSNNPTSSPSNPHPTISPSHRPSNSPIPAPTLSPTWNDTVYGVVVHIVLSVNTNTLPNDTSILLDILNNATHRLLDDNCSVSQQTQNSHQLYIVHNETIFNITLLFCDKDSQQTALQQVNKSLNSDIIKAVNNSEQIRLKINVDQIKVQGVDVIFSRDTKTTTTDTVETSTSLDDEADLQTSSTASTAANVVVIIVFGVCACLGCAIIAYYIWMKRDQLQLARSGGPVYGAKVIQLASVSTMSSHHGWPPMTEPGSASDIHSESENTKHVQDIVSVSGGRNASDLLPGIWSSSSGREELVSPTAINAMNVMQSVSVEDDEEVVDDEEWIDGGEIETRGQGHRSTINSSVYKKEGRASTSAWRSNSNASKFSTSQPKGGQFELQYVPNPQPLGGDIDDDAVMRQVANGGKQTRMPPPSFHDQPVCELERDEVVDTELLSSLYDDKLEIEEHGDDLEVKDEEQILWDSYIEQFGYPPKTATYLLEYSKKSNLKRINFKEARSIMKRFQSSK